MNIIINNGLDHPKPNQVAEILEIVSNAILNEEYDVLMDGSIKIESIYGKIEVEFEKE